jgi:hypothetical protein
MLNASTQGLVPLMIFALAGAMTPGPNNTIAMLTGANRGIRAVMPHLLGVPTGFAVMTALMGTGLGALLLAAKPAWSLALQACGALYLLVPVLAAGESPVKAGGEQGSISELGFLQSVAFQFSNRRRTPRRSAAQLITARSVCSAASVGHEVLELVDEAALAGDVRGALVEHAADVRGERHVGQQLAREDALALVDLGVGEGEPGLGQLDVAALDRPARGTRDRAGRAAAAASRRSPTARARDCCRTPGCGRTSAPPPRCCASPGSRP